MIWNIKNIKVYITQAPIIKLLLSYPRAFMSLSLSAFTKSNNKA